MVSKMLVIALWQSIQRHPLPLKWAANELTLVIVHNQIYWIRTNLQRFQPRMLNATFKIFILHYIMECVDNLCSARLL